jgi:hypothetical protein
MCIFIDELCTTLDSRIDNLKQSSQEQHGLYGVVTCNDITLLPVPKVLYPLSSNRQAVWHVTCRQ